MWTANQPPNALWWRGLQLAHTETLLSYETVLGLNAISKNEQRLHSIAPDTCTPRMKEAEEVHTPKRRKTMAHPFPPHTSSTSKSPIFCSSQKAVGWE